MPTTAPLSSTFFVAGGTMPADAPSYVERQADRDLQSSLRAGEYCYVLDSRQVGKSSMLIRAMAVLRVEGVRVGSCDLQRLGSGLTAEQFYQGLLVQIGRGIGLEREMLRAWQAHRAEPPFARFRTVLHEIALEQSEQPLVVLVDEIELLRRQAFDTDEFLVGIRSFFTDRAEDPAFRRLTFCLAGSSTPDALIQNVTVTPFNIGTRIVPTDFTLAEAQPFADALTATGRDGDALLNRVLYWTSGHPYLTQRVCMAVFDSSEARTPAAMDAIVAKLYFSKDPEDGQHLSFMNRRIEEDPTFLRDPAGLIAVYRSLHHRFGRSSFVPEDPKDLWHALLKLSGLALPIAGMLSVRNRTYHTVFGAEWIARHMPDAELRRQSTAYRRGVVRATAVSALVLAIVSGLGLAAVNRTWEAVRERRRADIKTADEVRQRREAQGYAERNRQLLYVADMNLASQACDEGEFGHAIELLVRHRADRDLHGFEWRYLRRLCKGEQLRILGGAGPSIAYSPDGKLLVAAGYDGEVQIWDVQTGRERQKFHGHKTRSMFVGFNPTGRNLVSVGQDETVNVWNVASRHLDKTILGQNPHGQVFDTSASLAPDGQEVAVANIRGMVKFWNVNTGKVSRTRLNSKSSISTVAYAPGGKSLAVGGMNGDIQFWDIGSRRLERTIHAHVGPIYCLAFTPKNHLVASGSIDGTVLVWDFLTGKPIAKLIGHRGDIQGLFFFRDGRTLATASGDNLIKIWDIATARLLVTLRGHCAGLTGISLASDGRTFATASNDRTVRIWDSAVSADKAIANEHSDWVYTSAFSPNGNYIATGSRDSTVRLWDAKSGMVRTVLHACLGSVLSIAFSPDGRTLAAAGGFKDSVNAPGELTLWDVSSGRKIGSLVGHTGCIAFTGFSGDGKTLITASTDQTLRYWDVALQKEKYRYRFPRHMTVVFGAFSTDRSWLAYGGEDSGIEIWDVNKKLDLHASLGIGWTNSASFSHDGKLMAVTNAKSIVLIDLINKKLFGTLVGHTANPMCVAFSADDKTLASGGLDQTVKLWNVALQQEMITLRGHKAPVLSMVFSPDGTRLISTGGDHKVIQWQALPFTHSGADETAEAFVSDTMGLHTAGTGN